MRLWRQYLRERRHCRLAAKVQIEHPELLQVEGIQRRLSMCCAMVEKVRV
jgi:hypothetical protein